MTSLVLFVVSVRLQYTYTHSSSSVFEISFWKFSQIFFSPKSCSFVIIANIVALLDIAAIQTERSKSSAYMENFFIWHDIFTKFGIYYFSRHSFYLRIYYTDRSTVAYSCHTNCSIHISFFILLCCKKCIYEGY